LFRPLEIQYIQQVLTSHTQSNAQTHP